MGGRQLAEGCSWGNVGFPAGIPPECSGIFPQESLCRMVTAMGFRRDSDRGLLSPALSLGYLHEQRRLRVWLVKVSSGGRED